MIWATVSSQSYFCWMYRASPSLPTGNIINLISILTIWWCSCVESSVVLLEESVFYDSLSLSPASFFTLRPNLPVTPDVSWLPAFAFQSPIMKSTSFLGVSSINSCRSSWNLSTSAFNLQHYSSRHRLGMNCDIEWFALETNRYLSVVFETASKYCILDSCWLWWLLHFF